MGRILQAILERTAEAGIGGAQACPEAAYRRKASQNGVEYLGSYPEHGVSLFRDPVTGSTFAVRDNEAMEAGIARVRTRFGLP